MKKIKKTLALLWRKRSNRHQPSIVPEGGRQRMVVENSKIHHLGAFASEGVRKGDKIRIMSGDIIDFAEVMRRIKRGKITPDDPLQIDTDLFIDLDPSSLAINHSCNPNAGIKGRDELIAIRDILVGEEVTFDYSATVSCSVEPSAWTMKCNCSSENCRSIIGNVLSIPKPLLMGYLQMGALQNYIIEELSDHLP